MKNMQGDEAIVALIFMNTSVVLRLTYVVVVLLHDVNLKEQHSCIFV